VGVDDPADALGGGTVVVMSYQPQELVFVSVTTSNQDQAVLIGVHARVHHGKPRSGADGEGAGRGRHAAPGRYHLLSGPGPREQGRPVLQALHVWAQEVNCELANQDYYLARVRVGLEASSTLTSETGAAAKAY
jgi:hypothetical protein